MDCNEDEHSTESTFSSPTLFKLSGVDTNAGDVILEESLKEILGLNITLLERDYNEQKGTILFCCQDNDGFEGNSGQSDAHIITLINELLQTPIESRTKFWCQASGTTAAISIVDDEDEDDECVEYITEEEAYKLWLEQNKGDANDSDDLSELVSSPDGALVRPKHHACNLKDDDDEASQHASPLATCTTKQLERDPGLFDFDNVERVHYSKILDFLSTEKHSRSIDCQEDLWKRDFGSNPIVITGVTDCNDDDDLAKQLLEFQQTLREAIHQYGADTIVRTGNRETLVENGFYNSRAATLLQVVDSTVLHPNDGIKNPDQTIVFNPIHEMPPTFRSERVLGRWIISTTTNTQQLFPNTLWNAILGNNENSEELVPPKFTLCIANEGFGIGMHKHGPALFFLTQGKKKWYLSHPNVVDEKIDSHNAADETSPTHPQFYRELSSHKCIQQPGELLLVPNLWYHEIYNLATPTIGIQALADELPVPGTLWV